MYGDDINRGEIKCLKRYKQLISYEGLIRHRKITPTDIDGVIDYAGNAFIFMECKLEGIEIEKGQKLAIENIINGLYEGGKKACCLLFRHNKVPEEIILAKDCIVSEIYYEGKWKYYNKNNVLYCVKAFEDKWKSKGIYI